MNHEKESTGLRPTATKKVLSYIGLATKAGKLASGEFMTEKVIKEGKAKLVIIAEDASNNTRKMFTNMCTYYKVPIYFFGDKTNLGHALGKEFRASLVLLDKGLADAVEKQLNTINLDEGIDTDTQSNLGGSKYGKNESI